MAATIAPFLFLVNGHWAFFGAALAMTLLIYLRHRANILRLLDGTEPRIGRDDGKSGKKAQKGASSKGPGTESGEDTPSQDDATAAKTPSPDQKPPHV